MSDQVGRATLRLSRRSLGVAAACAFLAVPGFALAAGDPLQPDPSPTASGGGLGPDSGAPAPAAPAPRTSATATRAPVQPAAPTPRTIVRTAPPIVHTVTVIEKVHAAPAPPARKATPKPAAKPKPKPAARPARPHRILPLGVRFAVAGANTTVSAASLALPAALAFVTLIGASGGFLALIYRLRREMAQA